MMLLITISSGFNRINTASDTFVRLLLVEPFGSVQNYIPLLPGHGGLETSDRLLVNNAHVFLYFILKNHSYNSCYE
jgi:hypothetical protein